MFGRLRRGLEVLEQAEESYSSVAPRAAASLARDFVVTTLDPDTGRMGVDQPDLMVAAALLVELAGEGRIEVSGSGRKLRVAVVDSAPLGDEALDDALLRMATGVLGLKGTRLLRWMPKTPTVLGHLVEAGVLEERPDTTRKPPLDRHYPTPAAGRDQLVTRVRSALLGESLPDQRTAQVISILATSDNVKHFVPKDRRKDARRRAKEILERLGEDDRAIVAGLVVAVRAAYSR